MRQVDTEDKHGALGPPIRPAPAKPGPVETSRKGVFRNPDGTLSTNIPTPPAMPGIWDQFLKPKTRIIVGASGLQYPDLQPSRKDTP